MTKKYTELKAFETNEFKVGDRVALYGCCECLEWGKTFSVFDGNELEIIRTSNGSTHFIVKDSLDREYEVHFKQARKLVEVEPREFYIELTEGRVACSEAQLKKLHERMIDLGHECPQWIKVREVLEDEQ